MSKKQQANLIFDRGDPSGFGVLAEQSELNPTTIVRELVQNSLDAAREADRDTVIRFELIEHDIKDIPAIDRYKKVLGKAKKVSEKRHAGTLPDTEQSIVSAIERQVNLRKIDTLFVMDNGIGLNEARMDALLADGISYKSRGGAGSFGYGHTTVIPASDLRYMLYGGFSNDIKIASGHAVLSAFEEDGEIKGKDGYFIVKKTGKMLKPFVYPSNKAIPAIIKSRLDTIEEDWGDSGSVVAIPGFNYFNEDEVQDYPPPLKAVWLWGEIAKAVACNFFVAITQGRLQIEFPNDAFSTALVLDKDSIDEVLDRHKDEMRAKFLNGHKANKAYAAMTRGKNHKVDTVLGKIEIKLYKLPSGGVTQVDLCRNGMHITNRVPKLGIADFENYEPFHCLILTDASDKGDFHRLIRKSEPPKHNEIALKRLEKEERAKVNQTLDQIKAYIKEQIKPLKTDEFGVDDVLNLRSYGINTIEVLPPRVRTGGDSGGGGGGSGAGDGGGGGSDGFFKKEGRAISFSATPVPMGKRSYAVQIALEESKHDNEIRFSLDESLDITCYDNASEDFVYLKNVKIDGKKVAEEKLISNEAGKILGINLGSGKDEKDINLTFDFDIPGDINIDKDMTVGLKAEMVSRKIEQAE